MRAAESVRPRSAPRKLDVCFFWTIGVGEPDCFPMPVGQANRVGRTVDGLAMWALRVKGADVPGRFVIVDGRFVEA